MVQYNTKIPIKKNPQWIAWLHKLDKTVWVYLHFLYFMFLIVCIHIISSCRDVFVKINTDTGVFFMILLGGKRFIF